MPAPKRLLLIFLKEPTPGKVKTRLGKDIGDEQAALHYRAMVRVLLRQLRGLQDTKIRFCYSPDDAEEASKFWLLPLLEGEARMADSTSLELQTESPFPNQIVDFVAQGQGDLGERLIRAFETAFSEAFETVGVIGSDCIDISSRWIHTAFAQLKQKNDLSIGPTPDGGYYFLALKKFYPQVFQSIEWSSHATFEQTIRQSEHAELNSILLPKLSDIDNLTDWNNALARPIGTQLKNALNAEQEFYNPN